MKIIGLAGKAGSGKSYIAKNILASSGYLPLALAGPMKSQLAAEGVIPVGEAIGLEDKSPRTRRILQLYGTELGRDRFYENIWCVRLEWWISWFLANGHDDFVVTDIRFPNEVEWIRDMHGLVVRVVGRGGLDGIAAEHDSETALDHLDLPELDNTPGRQAVLSGHLMEMIQSHYEENPEPEPFLYD